MATLAGFHEDDENKTGTGAAAGQQQLSSTAGGTMGATGGGGSARASGPSGSAKGGSGFVNLQRYLDANRQQTPQMTGRVVGHLDEKAQGAKTAVGNTYGEFETAAEKGRNRQDAGVIGNLRNAGFSNITGDQNTLSTYNRMLGGKYGGPNTLQETGSYGTTLDSVNKADELVKSSDTAGGRYALLQDVFNGGGQKRYTTGESRLDNALISADPNSRGQFADVRSRHADLQDTLTGAETRASDLATGYVKEAGETKDATIKARGTGTGKISSQASGLVKGAQSAANQGYQAEIDRVLALGLDPNQYVTKGRTVAVSDVADSNMTKQKEALARLGGDTSWYTAGGPGSTGHSFDQKRYDAYLADQAERKARENEAARLEAERAKAERDTWDEQITPTEKEKKNTDIFGRVAKIGKSINPFR